MITFNVGDMVVLDDPSYFRKELQGQIGTVIGFARDYSGALIAKVMMTDKNLTPKKIGNGYHNDTLADHWEPHSDRLRLATHTGAVAMIVTLPRSPKGSL